jgi:arylsulfatase A-like enzyme
VRSAGPPWIAAFLALWVGAGCAPSDARPNLVLITLDTTRADHLGPYGYAPARTPALDAFARDAVLYERAYSTSSWTLPSHASIFTGLLPMQHGAQSVPGSPEQSLGYGVRPLGPRFTTLAERLRRAGYHTAAVIGGPALRRDMGVAQGFDRYDDELGEGLGRVYGRRAEEVADVAIGWVEEFGRDPFFLFVNFFDPHAPFDPPPPYNRGLSPARTQDIARSLLERLGQRSAPPLRPEDLSPSERRELDDLRAGYDAEIAYMDLHLARLLEVLQAAPRWEKTWVVITGDHGESFGEHAYISHGGHLYEDNVHVPLLIRPPGGAGPGQRVGRPVENRLVFPLLMRAAGIDVAGPARPEASDAPIVTEVRRSELNIQFNRHFDRDLRALYQPPFKLIRSSRDDGEHFQLFDLESDPHELHDLAAKEPERVGSLRSALERVTESAPPLFQADARAELSEETEEALRALGYIP